MTSNAQSSTIFDQEHYLRHIEARGQFIRRMVPELQRAVGFQSALDAGCGVGFFAALLKECGLSVEAFDGRENNVDNARKRYPEIDFSQGDIEDKSILGLGEHDLVLCFGLLYHLENPLKAIRNLRALTKKVLLLETMCLPVAEPTALLRIEPDSDDQSLTDLAFYASEGCIVKMLYHAGFKTVYRAAELPDHDDFRETETHIRRRTVLIAGFEPIRAQGMTPMPEPHETRNPWDKDPTNIQRVQQYLASPRGKKYEVTAKKLQRRFPNVPIPIRLPFGAWWIPRKDHVSEPIVAGNFESSELAFVERFLQPGMTVLDIGAHHGLYTLLAAKRVGPLGKVWSFEPSTRERKALKMHLRMNLCTNVNVQDAAVGDESGEATLHVVEAWAGGCNSLRPPDIPAQTSVAKVKVIRLDDWLAQNGGQRVDFIKLDVEGAEWGVLKGAAKLLAERPRPVILAEVQDLRTAPWGYPAREIVGELERSGYEWFQISPQGTLIEFDSAREVFDHNLVAVPNEQRETVTARVNRAG
jgi:FkbM family methyltransferase